jgi:exonuclease SbcD
MEETKLQLLHISDLHIGIKLYNRDLINDQQYVFDQIIEYVKRYTPDVIIIAGDIYDKPVPSAESVQLFDSFMEKLYNASDNAQIMLISGNHDSPQRIDYLSWILERQRFHIAGIPPKSPDDYIKRITLQDQYGDINFYLLPFVKPSIIKGVFDNDTDNTYSYNEAIHKLFEHELINGHINPDNRNVLISHQFYLPKGLEPDQIERSDSEISTVGNIDEVSNDVLTPFDYVALGHIHKPMTVGENRFRYSGTPLAYSISEANQEKGALLVDIRKKGELEIKKLPLKPLHNITTIEDTFENVLKQPSEDYVQIILTDKDDLDVVDLKERLNIAFPNLLEIQRKYTRGLDFASEHTEIKDISPYELINEFIPDMDEEEQEIMKSVINEAMEVDNL